MLTEGRLQPVGVMARFSKIIFKPITNKCQVRFDNRCYIGFGFALKLLKYNSFQIVVTFMVFYFKKLA